MGVRAQTSREKQEQVFTDDHRHPNPTHHKDEIGSQIEVYVILHLSVAGDEEFSDDVGNGERKVSEHMWLGKHAWNQVGELTNSSRHPFFS
jgi:hypothetical protein